MKYFIVGAAVIGTALLYLISRIYPETGGLMFLAGSGMILLYLLNRSFPIGIVKPRIKDKD